MNGLEKQVGTLRVTSIILQKPKQILEKCEGIWDLNLPNEVTNSILTRNRQTSTQNNFWGSVCQFSQIRLRQKNVSLVSTYTKLPRGSPPALLEVCGEGTCKEFGKKTKMIFIILNLERKN